MSKQKQTDFLDIGSSDDEGSQGYNSDDFQESKGRDHKRKRLTSSVSQSKRQKLSDDEADTDGSDEDLDILDLATAVDDAAQNNIDFSPTTSFETESAPTEPSITPLSSSQTPVKVRKNKTGVIYLSSLPPYLKPSALKSLLVARGFSPITKIFLSPFVPSTGVSRAAAKGSRNKRRMYTDGWVEFASKRTAKICAEALNASIVGGKKGGWYHDDLWNMRYLRGFKWTDLMEQVQREKREAEARRRIEDSKARKEEKAFLQGLEQGKIVEGIKKKKEERAQSKAEKGDNETPTHKKIEVRRVFRQNEVRGSAAANASGVSKKVDPDAQRVLSKVF